MMEEAVVLNRLWDLRNKSRKKLLGFIYLSFQPSV